MICNWSGEKNLTFKSDETVLKHGYLGQRQRHPLGQWSRGNLLPVTEQSSIISCTVLIPLLQSGELLVYYVILRLLWTWECFIGNVWFAALISCSFYCLSENLGICFIILHFFRLWAITSNLPSELNLNSFLITNFTYVFYDIKIDDFAVWIILLYFMILCLCSCFSSV